MLININEYVPKLAEKVQHRIHPLGIAAKPEQVFHLANRNQVL
jgi:hypothetical protein